MYRNAIAAALLGSSIAVAQSLGDAAVVNQCNYPVFLQNTPAADGGQSTISKTLSANGGSYQQQWQSLTNGEGWSLKLSKSATDMSQILQYEYTYHTGDGTPLTGDDASQIWFDISAVNGDPWAGEWDVSANGNGCNPQNRAYRFSTDDAFGMQSCPSLATITLTLCPSGSGEAPAQAPAPGSSTSGAEAATMTVAAATSSEVSEAPPASTNNLGTPLGTIGGSVGGVLGGAADGVEAGKVAADPKPSLTTFATMASAVLEPGSVTVVEVDTVFTTAIVMATEAPKKQERHAHHPHHHHS